MWLAQPTMTGLWAGRPGLRLNGQASSLPLCSVKMFPTGPTPGVRGSLALVTGLWAGFPEPALACWAPIAAQSCSHQPLPQTTATHPTSWYDYFILPIADHNLRNACKNSFSNPCTIYIWLRRLQHLQFSYSRRHVGNLHIKTRPHQLTRAVTFDLSDGWVTWHAKW